MNAAITVATEPFRVVSQPIVALQNVQLTLTSRAGPVEVLRDVCLRVEAGQSLAVVGPSGSGKTSLLMVVAGLERATSCLLYTSDAADE